MKFTQSDLDGTFDLADVLTKIDNFNADYANTLTDEIFNRQPFFLTVLVGYSVDVAPEELEEIMKLYFLVWEYFRLDKEVQTKKVTRAYFEKVQLRNIAMFKYTEDESDHNTIKNIYSNDLKNLKSKPLLAAIFFRFKNRPVLAEMDNKCKGIVLIGIKSFIECFETI